MLINTLGGAEMRLRRAAYVAPVGGGDPDAPTISNVSGTVATGQNLAVTGSNLIREDTTGYDPDFDVDEFNCNGSSWTGDGFVNGANFTYDSETKLIGNNAPKAETAYSGENSHGVGAGTGRDTLSSTPGHHFISMYCREDFSYGNGTWADIQQKLYNNYGGTRHYNVNWNANAGDAYNGIYVDLDGDATTSVSSTGLSFTHQQNRWNHVEVEVPGSAPWTLRVWVNEQLAIEENFAGDPGIAPADTELVINTQSTDSGYGIRQWIDGFRASSQRIGMFSRYEITDDPDYASAATKVYQFPEFLADGSATIICDLTGLSGGNYYLWCTNHRGDRSAAYAL